MSVCQEMSIWAELKKILGPKSEELSRNGVSF